MTVVRRGPLNSQGNLNHSCYQSGLLGVVTCIPVALESSSSLQNSSRLSVSSDETNTSIGRPVHIPSEVTRSKSAATEAFLRLTLCVYKCVTSV